MRPALVSWMAVTIVMAVSGVGCDAGSSEQRRSPDKESAAAAVAGNKADAAFNLASICEEFGLAPECDLCAEFGWYGDGQCDKGYCRNHDVVDCCYPLWGEIEACHDDGLDLVACMPGYDSPDNVLAKACCQDQFKHPYCASLSTGPSEVECYDLNAGIEECANDGLDMAACVPRWDSADNALAHACCQDRFNYPYCASLANGPSEIECYELNAGIEDCANDGLDLGACVPDPAAPDRSLAEACCQRENAYPYCSVLGM